MNIFVLDLDPAKAAQYHCDKHVNKMFIESVQLLSNCLPETKAPYKRAYYMHPCSVWARDTPANTKWLVQLALALENEFQVRYGKPHKTSGALRVIEHHLKAKLDTVNEQPTAFCLTMPDEYKTDNPVESYRHYYKKVKSAFAKWSKATPAPNWWDIKPV
jgi:hypothetical protein